jgi:hypothetical protein
MSIPIAGRRKTYAPNAGHRSLLAHRWLQETHSMNAVVVVGSLALLVCTISRRCWVAGWPDMMRSANVQSRESAKIRHHVNVGRSLSRSRRSLVSVKAASGKDVTGLRVWRGIDSGWVAGSNKRRPILLGDMGLHKLRTLSGRSGWMSRLRCLWCMA